MTRYNLLRTIAFGSTVAFGTAAWFDYAQGEQTLSAAVGDTVFAIVALAFLIWLTGAWWTAANAADRAEEALAEQELIDSGQHLQQAIVDAQHDAFTAQVNNALYGKADR